MSNRALLATSGATLCMLGMGFAFSKVAMVTSSFLIGDTLHDIYSRCHHAQLKQAKERAEKALSELPLPVGADRERGERAALMLIKSHLKNWDASPQDFSGRKEDVPAAILEAVIPLEEVPEDDGVRDMLLLVFEEAFSELRKDPHWAAVFVQEQLFAILEEMKSVQSLMRELQKIADSNLGVAQEPPSTAEACFKELVQLDDRLAGTRGATSERAAWEERRSYLVSWLSDVLNTSDHPEQYAFHFVTLLKTRTWNEPRLRSQKAAYIDIVAKLIDRIDQDEPHALELMVQAVNNLALNGHRLSARQLIGRFRNRMTAPKSNSERLIALENSDYAMESGEYIPDDFRALVDGKSANEVALNEAKWYRCLSCRFSSERNYELAEESLMMAIEHIEIVPAEHREHGSVSSYIKALSALIKWRANREATSALEEDVEEAIKAMTVFNYEDEPLRAALYHLKIEMSLARRDHDGVDVDILELVETANNVHSLLQDAVPGYCMLNIPGIQTDADEIRNDPNAFLRQ